MAFKKNNDEKTNCPSILMKKTSLKDRSAEHFYIVMLPKDKGIFYVKDWAVQEENENDCRVFLYDNAFKVYTKDEKTLPQFVPVDDIMDMYPKNKVDRVGKHEMPKSPKSDAMTFSVPMKSVKTLPVEKYPKYKNYYSIACDLSTIHFRDKVTRCNGLVTIPKDFVEISEDKKTATIQILPSASYSGYDFTSKSKFSITGRQFKKAAEISTSVPTKNPSVEVVEQKSDVEKKSEVKKEKVVNSPTVSKDVNKTEKSVPDKFEKISEQADQIDTLTDEYDDFFGE